MTARNDLVAYYMQTVTDQILELIKSEELGSTLYVDPAAGFVRPAREVPGTPDRITEEVLMWDNSDAYGPVNSWDRIDLGGERPAYYHLFESCESLQSAPQVFWHLGGMIEDGKPFLVQTAMVDAYPGEDEEESSPVGWAILAKLA